MTEIHMFSNPFTSFSRDKGFLLPLGAPLFVASRQFVKPVVKRSPCRNFSRQDEFEACACSRTAVLIRKDKYGFYLLL